MAFLVMTLVWLVIVYLIGSIPFGLLVAQTCCRIDPRQSGSKNTGATNISRLCGTRYGIATLLLDIGKGFLMVLLAMAISKSAIFLSLSALAVLLGHMYSIFLDFKGGKGVATTIGIFAALTPLPLLIALLLCALTIWWTGYVSVGSLTIAASVPVLMLITGAFAYIPLGIIIALLVFKRHQENILRLARGEEKSWRKNK
jgi:glycerol-3-phosphate acyltransferase PlsY